MFEYCKVKMLKTWFRIESVSIACSSKTLDQNRNERAANVSRKDDRKEQQSKWYSKLCVNEELNRIPKYVFIENRLNNRRFVEIYYVFLSICCSIIIKCTVRMHFLSPQMISSFGFLSFLSFHTTSGGVCNDLNANMIWFRLLSADFFPSQMICMIL